MLRTELDLKEREASEYFVRWILKSENMYDGVVNSNVVERFRPIVKDALTRVVRDIVRRSVSAMEQVAAQPGTSQPAAAAPPESPPASAPSVDLDPDAAARRAIETTDRELEAFAVVKGQFERSALASVKVFDASLRKEVPIELSYKDTTGYFGIYFNKHGWWVMRLQLDGRRHWVGFNVDETLGATLIPEGVSRLDPSPHAAFRVEIGGPADLDRLHRLIYAAFEQTIKDRAHPDAPA